MKIGDRVIITNEENRRYKRIGIIKGIITKSNDYLITFTPDSVIAVTFKFSISEIESLEQAKFKLL